MVEINSIIQCYQGRPKRDRCAPQVQNTKKRISNCVSSHLLLLTTRQQHDERR